MMVKTLFFWQTISLGFSCNLTINSIQTIKTNRQSLKTSHQVPQGGGHKMENNEDLK